MEMRYVGASYLRKLTTEALMGLDETVVLAVDGVPKAAIVSWEEYERLCGGTPRTGAPFLAHAGDAMSELLRGQGELLEGVRKLLGLEGMLESLVQYMVEGRAPSGEVGMPSLVNAPPVSSGSHTINCLHCGERRFGATRHATICSECKSAGHTLAPAECPRCTEGEAI